MLKQGETNGIAIDESHRASAQNKREDNTVETKGLNC